MLKFRSIFPYFCATKEKMHTPLSHAWVPTLPFSAPSEDKSLAIAPAEKSAKRKFITHAGLF